MALSRSLLVVVMGLALGGCSSIRQDMDRWFGAKEEGGEAGQIYYSGTAGLAVHAEAAGSSKTLDRLDLHEKVTRTRLERGYAYITSHARALEGWVDNAQLIWRLPPRQADSASEAEPPATAADPAPAPQAVVPETTPPTPEPAASAPPPPAKPVKARPDMFNPF